MLETQEVVRMKIAFTFHNLEPSDALKNLATEKLAKLEKYMRGAMSASVTFGVERHTCSVDVSVHAGSETYLGHEEQEDMYAAVNLVVDKLRHQVSRAHAASTHHRRRDPAQV
jgi:putative sigma-54 modulation protein